MKPIIVEVLWIDIAGYPGWGTGRKLSDFKPAECRTVGYLLEKGKLVKIAGTMNLSDIDVGDVLVIPISNVKKIRRLR